MMRSRFPSVGSIQDLRWVHASDNQLGIRVFRNKFLNQLMGVNFGGHVVHEVYVVIAKVSVAHSSTGVASDIFRLEYRVLDRAGGWQQMQLSFFHGDYAEIAWRQKPLQTSQLTFLYGLVQGMWDARSVRLRLLKTKRGE
jgi:hypothetical protein